MDKSNKSPSENNTKVKKSSISKLSAFRRGLKEKQSKNKKDDKEKVDKVQKPTKAYSLIKKLKLGKSVSNPALGSAQTYLTSEIVEESETLEKTGSMSSVSTDVASTSGPIRSLDSDMSAAESNRRSTDEVASGSSPASTVTHTHSSTPAPEDEEDSYESFQESENAHDIQANTLSTDKSEVSESKPSEVSNPEPDCANPTSEPEMPAFSDLIFDKQQENAQTVILFIYIFNRQVSLHLYIWNK